LLSTGLFAGIKDSSGTWDDFLFLKAAREKQAFALLIGNDAIYTRAREAGADGVVSGCGCAVPELMLAIDRAVQAGNAEAAERLDARLKEFIAWIERFPSPLGVREAVRLRGIKTGPHATPLGPNGRAKLAEFGEWFGGWLPTIRKECQDA
jgi:4-hydroxy-tetrahydrodipicolinate synthase